MSRPPSVSVSPKRSSFCTRRSASRQIHRWTGLSIRSNAVARLSGGAERIVRICYHVLEESYRLPPIGHSERFTARVVAEVAVASLGGALLICALLANQQWLDRHFMPSFFLSRSKFVLEQSVVRVAIAALGAALALAARRRIGRFIAHRPGRALNVMVAGVLAFGASEFILRVRHFRATMVQEEPVYIEPSRRLDPQLGWVFVPSRVGHDNVGGRIVEYAT